MGERCPSRPRASGWLRASCAPVDTQVCEFLRTQKDEERLGRDRANQAEFRLTMRFSAWLSGGGFDPRSA